MNYVVWEDSDGKLRRKVELGRALIMWQVTNRGSWNVSERRNPFDNGTILDRAQHVFSIVKLTRRRLTMWRIILGRWAVYIA